jgi:hypothetical protein
MEIAYSMTGIRRNKEPDVSGSCGLVGWRGGSLHIRFRLGLVEVELSVVFISCFPSFFLSREEVSNMPGWLGGWLVGWLVASW